MARLIRLDAELVRRGLARSRAQASALIKSGQVLLDGMEVLKPARQIDPAQALVVREKTDITYASRGAYKLLSAISYLRQEGFEIDVQDQVALDAGASTGGFTDVLVRAGAKHVYAVDVGYGQLAWSLRTNRAVEVRERTNVRYLQPADFDPAPTWVVADLSFISLTLVIPALYSVAAPGAQFLLMVKPQFEIGKDRLSAGGVVKDLEDHAQTVTKVARCALAQGAQLLAVAPSFLPGPAGNVEYFVYFSKPSGSAESTESPASPLSEQEVKQMVNQAISKGPAAEGKALKKTINLSGQDFALAQHLDHNEDVGAQQAASGKEDD